MKYSITYPGFLQTVTKVFDTYVRAVQWLQQVGKAEQIRNIRTIR